MKFDIFSVTASDSFFFQIRFYALQNTHTPHKHGDWKPRIFENSLISLSILEIISGTRSRVIWLLQHDRYHRLS
jgi:hypothetical protein